MVDAFAIDVMHMMDEGVARWFLSQIVEGRGRLRLTAAEIKEIDRRWIHIIVPGHESRSTRSISHFKMQAHELRFFLQHGAPYTTKDIVPEKFHSILYHASSIAWLATRDVITEVDLSRIERHSDLFLRKFQRFFGEANMKFSIHLMQHVAHTIQLHVPLQNISCYGK
ncbi:hypothetical protein RvY_00128-2 [Ramazzottius varieornatus]|uniref:Uncharacterized protein n=1 Tax=Ramazzottius varieornatus TaxID=947166 RepID=A0A1D1UJ37_RAMVA|nr:hypothetical protein RvY_00128-2 [Ramazzottius varieornatus]